MVVHTLGGIASIYAGIILFYKYIACIPVTHVKGSYKVDKFLYTS